MSLMILVVDDDEDVRETIITQLRAEGINEEVVTASDPTQGLALYNKYKDRISIAIINYLLPIENGVFLCKIIKEEMPGIKVIIFTGDHEITNNIDVSHVDVILYKPDGLSQIGHHVRKI